MKKFFAIFWLSCFLSVCFDQSDASATEGIVLTSCNAKSVNLVLFGEGKGNISDGKITSPANLKEITNKKDSSVRYSDSICPNLFAAKPAEKSPEETKELSRIKTNNAQWKKANESKFQFTKSKELTTPIRLATVERQINNQYCLSLLTSLTKKCKEAKEDSKTEIKTLKEEIKKLNVKIADHKKEIKSYKNSKNTSIIKNKEFELLAWETQLQTKEEEKQKLVAEEKDTIYSPLLAFAQHRLTSYQALGASPLSFDKLELDKIFRLTDTSSEYRLSLDSDSGISIFDKIIAIVTKIAGTLGVALLIVAAYFLIASHGDENMRTRGKEIIKYTIGGLLIIFTSYVLIRTFISILTN